ncbi:urea ABC transporter substrate-binding protein [Pseudodonghicola flavimaris]|uniref:Transporter substrate-binding protein n=1 Tax=Pseudodonghicola flavimaris TaxID=3050036 RepID=A0ABT7F1S1_9RHOB|nr:transporter substrate-binding protein [Pseudodonghicola flavimaris]MDK3018551.1 transporter substrate-binding protein [Pseudodonghicola flavimaris]
MTKLNRRGFLLASGATAATLSAPSILRAAADTIKVGGLHDLSGPLDASGIPMNQVLKLAIDEVNATGGLLGKEVEAVIYDPQSNMSLYSQYATQMALKDRVAVVQGGITSASRETIRPIFHRYQTLYFYNTLYEGGVCDRNEITLGTTPAQTVEQLIPHAMNLWGKKVYTIAADYNYGHITAAWVKRYVEANGGEVLETEFFPLDVTQFGSTISKIQAAKPDLVLSALVGTAHLGFYRQWAASGMKAEIPIASTTFAAGGTDAVILTPEEGNGILTSYGYYTSIDNPTNAAFKAKVKEAYPDDTPILSELSEVTWEGIMVWADAVRTAGSLDREALLEVMESGKSYDMPAGKVSIDPKTHHAIRDVYLAELQDQEFIIKETFPQVQPKDTQMVCNLEETPDANVHHEISLN